MSKLIELGIASRDTRATEPGIKLDELVVHTEPGFCLFYKVFSEEPGASSAEERPCDA